MIYINRTNRHPTRKHNTENYTSDEAESIDLRDNQQWTIVSQQLYMYCTNYYDIQQEQCILLYIHIIHRERRVWENCSAQFLMWCEEKTTNKRINETYQFVPDQLSIY